MGGDKELDAAGITDPELRASYAEARALNQRHGRTYFLATLLLPRHKRPAVHALYGFARHADDLVDLTPPGTTPHGQLDELEHQVDHPTRGEPLLLKAFRDAHARYDIDPRHTRTFLASMRTDLTQTDLTHDLDGYMEGSAAAIGLQMLPVLGTTRPHDAEPYARDLAFAFQLTNFVRDQAEDERRGRRYLTDPREAAQRARRLYRQADQGIRLLDPTSRDCVRTASRLYERILDEVEKQGWDTTTRATVPNRTRAVTAAGGLVRAVRARRTSTSTASA